MDFEAINAATVTEQLEARILGRILSGELKRGEKLPTENMLAEKMCISKSAVHIGLKNLERSGFLRISPRHGTFVADYGETGNIDTFTALLR